jgi:2-haloacid dehalogenase
MLDFSRFDAITFDCYGTLIDWETGILNALRPLLTAHGHPLHDSQILAMYGEIEPEIQKGDGFTPYRQVLGDLVRGFGNKLRFTPSAAEAESLPNSLRAWQPFPDTVAALQKLKARYKLAIISNIDDELFAHTARLLGVKFDAVITAQQAGAYKPSPKPFELALKRLVLPPGRVLHAGQSVYHDVIPARAMGMATVLVERRGAGATRPTEGEPDLRVQDMKSLAAAAVPG